MNKKRLENQLADAKEFAALNGMDSEVSIKRYIETIEALLEEQAFEYEWKRVYEDESIPTEKPKSARSKRGKK